MISLGAFVFEALKDLPHRGRFHVGKEKEYANMKLAERAMRRKAPLGLGYLIGGVAPGGKTSNLTSWIFFDDSQGLPRGKEMDHPEWWASCRYECESVVSDLPMAGTERCAVFAGEPEAELLGQWLRVLGAGVGPCGR